MQGSTYNLKYYMKRWNMNVNEGMFNSNNKMNE